jgi:hypothetical protein
MMRIGAKTFHTVVAAGLLLSAAWPVVEILCRSGDCIFLGGSDSETSIALLLLLLELAVISLKLIVCVAPQLLTRLFISIPRAAAAVEASLCPFVAPTPSPPLFLRI